MIIRRDAGHPYCACGCGTPITAPPSRQNKSRREKQGGKQYVHGHTSKAMNRKILDLPERFWAKVVVDQWSGCWEWTASKGRKGYGRGYGIFNLDGRPSKPHRLTYEALIGPIPEGLEIDHLCRNRGCCNPEHLEPVTHAENMARSFRALQTHCKRGHEFTEANTYRAKNGTRACRRCHADKQRAREAKAREQRAS